MNKMENPYTRVIVPRKSKFVKSFFLASFALFVMLILSSCEFWNQPVRDYFEKWTNKVSIEKYEINNVEFYEDKDGNVCIGSDQDAYVSLFLLNPYHYDFNSPEFSSKITYVQNETVGSSSLSFPDIIPDASDTTHLNLTYAKEFLKAYEGGHDIGAVITVEHPYNSGEKNEYNLVVKCNSKPPVINYGSVMQNNNTYYLCFNIAPSYISDIHTDIKQIVIDDGSNSRTSECHVESDGTIVLDSPDSLSKTSPGTLTAAGPGGSFSPDSTNAFYFNSGIAVEADREMAFTITLLDEAGLSSSTVISIASRQLEAPRAWDSVADIELVPSTTTSVLNTLVLDSNYEGLINLSLPTQTINGDPVSGVKVYYKLKENNTSSTSGGNRTEYANHDIIVSETGEHQLQVWAEKEGYVNSATVTYTIKIRPLVITFHKNDETTATATQEVSRGADVTLKSLSQLGLERTGYTFNGWATEPRGNKNYDDEGTITDVSTDRDLYARWNANNYQVTLNYNYTDATNSTIISVTYDSKYTALPSSDPSREGYRFDGWFTSATGGTKITDQTSCTTASDHTLYAHWTARTYTVTLKYNYTNYGTYTTITVPYDAKYSDYLPSNPGRTGYSFTEWWTSSNDTGSKIETGTTCTTASNHTLYAHWTVRTYTVTLKYNYPNNNSTYRTISVPYDAKYNDYLPQNPSRTGYSLAEWWTSADNTGTKIQTSTTCTTDSDHILYAHWNLNYHSVTCDSTNCSVSITSNVRDGNTYGYGSTVTVAITPISDYGVYSITVPAGLNATEPVESGTNGKTKTITFTMPDENVTVTRVIKKAINVNITPVDCNYNGINGFVKYYAKNKTVRIWLKTISTCYDGEGQYKEVTLDENGEYNGYICYPTGVASIADGYKLCVMSKTSFSDPSSDCRLFGYETLYSSSTNINIKLAVILFQPGPKSTPENTTELEFYEHGSSLYASTNWETLGFKFYWVNNKKDESNHWIPYRTAGPTTSNSYTWSTSQFFSGENIISAYISVAGIEADSNSGYTIDYP